jgi:hypothetical protein
LTVTVYLFELKTLSEGFSDNPIARQRYTSR